MNFAADWNPLDSFIYFCESRIKNIMAEQKEEEPDVELMIQAETEFLRKENDRLKKRELPIWLIEKDGMLLCPKCNASLSDPDIRYCPNCGHRVIAKGKGIIK